MDFFADGQVAAGGGGEEAAGGAFVDDDVGDWEDEGEAGA